MEKNTIRQVHDKRWQKGEILLERFKVLGIIEGGFGTVYIVEDQEDLRRLAAKTFRDEYLWTPQVIERFNCEANTWLDLDEHENIVMAEFIQTIKGKPYIFLEYVEGSTLGAWIHRGYLDLRQSLDFAIQFCTGMRYACDKFPGIVHRDIKPDNILITLDAALKITDWGLAKTDEEIAGISFGTPEYMAPEQFEDATQVTTLADIYSFGIVFYEMLTSRLPYYGNEGTRFERMKRAHQCDYPRAPSKIVHEIPPYIDDLALSCLEKKTSNRPFTFEDLLTAFRQSYRKHTGKDWIRLRNPEEWGYRQWANRGVSLVELGRLEEAVVAYDKALEKNPEGKYTWNNKGILLEKLNRNKEAIACYDKAIEIDPDLSMAWNNKGNALHSLGLLNDALVSFDKALSINPEYDMALNNKGWLLRKSMDNSQEALRCFESATRINPNVELAWNNQGLALGDLKRLQEALACLDKALEVNPRFAMAWSNKAGQLLKLERTEEALDCCDIALAIDESDSGAWNNKGLVLKAMNEHETALTSFNKAIELDPENDLAQCNKADLLAEICRYNDAIVVYQMAIDQKPDHADYHESLGFTYQKVGEFDEALIHHSKAIEIDPGKSLSHYNLGLVLTNLGDLKGAIKAFRNAITHNPDYVEAYNNLGATLHKVKMYKEAIEAYRKCIRIDPNHALVNNNLALSLVELNQFDEAMNCYREAIKIRPDYAAAYYNMGVLSMKQENINLAIEYFLKTVEHDPEYYEAYSNLGALSLQKGDYSKAIEFCNKALDINPEFYPAKVNLQTAETERAQFQSRGSCKPLWQIQVGSGVIMQGLAIGRKGNLLGMLARDHCEILDVQAQKNVGYLDFPWHQDRLFFQKIQFSIDGSVFVAAGGKALSIYQISTRIMAQATMNNRIGGFWLSPDNKHLALEQNNIFNIYHIGNDSITKAFTFPSALPAGAGLGQFTFSPDGKLIALPGTFGEPSYEIRNLHTAAIMKSLHYPCMLMAEPRFSRDGKSLSALVLVDESFTIVIWDIIKGKVRETLKVKGPSEGIHDTSFSPYGSYYAGIQESDKTIELINTNSHEIIKFGSNQGRNLIFSPDEKYLTSIDFNNVINTWQLDQIV